MDPADIFVNWRFGERRGEPFDCVSEFDKPAGNLERKYFCPTRAGIAVTPPVKYEDPQVSPRRALQPHAPTRDQAGPTEAIGGGSSEEYGGGKRSPQCPREPAKL